MMIVPDAANMPPTPWQTEIRARGLGGGNAAHLAHALLQCVHAGMHVRKPAAIGVERQLAAGSGVASGDEGAGLATLDKAQILEAVDRPSDGDHRRRRKGSRDYRWLRARIDQNEARTYDQRCCPDIFAAVNSPMPDVTADPPVRTCYSPAPEFRIEENQMVDPDLSCPRARAREGTPTKLHRPEKQELHSRRSRLLNSTHSAAAAL